MALPRKGDNKSPSPAIIDLENDDVTIGSPEFDPSKLPDTFHVRDRQSEFMLTHSKVDSIVSLLELNEVPEDAVTRLIHALTPYQETNFDEDYSLRSELVIQMQLVKSVRMSILDGAGRVKKDTTVQEVKSVLDSSMKLADMLNKVNKDLVNHERLQAVEAAFMDVVVQILERRMKAQKALQQS